MSWALYLLLHDTVIVKPAGSRLSRNSDGEDRINRSRNVNLLQSSRQSRPLVKGEDYRLGMHGCGESQQDKNDASHGCSPTGLKLDNIGSSLLGALIIRADEVIQ